MPMSPPPITPTTGASSVVVASSSSATVGRALVLEDISVSYGDSPVVCGVDLRLEEGEFFGLIGLNGAGKTTVLKSILGLRSPCGGTIKLDGDRGAGPAGQGAAKKEIAYLPERFEPPWFLTGVEFIRFSLALYNHAVSSDVIEGMADCLALDRSVLSKKVQTYSKGMRQKLGLIATVLTPCRFLVLDEPMSGLDPKARSLVKDMFGRLRQEGRTVLLSSHILADMDEICDRVAVLHEGAIKFTGAPSLMKKEQKTRNLEKAFLQIIEGNY